MDNIFQQLICSSQNEFNFCLKKVANIKEKNFESFGKEIQFIRIGMKIIPIFELVHRREKGLILLYLKCSTIQTCFKDKQVMNIQHDDSSSRIA